MTAGLLLSGLRGPPARVSVKHPGCLAPCRRARCLSHMSAGEIRRRYVDFFVRNGHSPLESAPIVPKGDRSLLFTNAGMVPFKQYFVDPSTAPHRLVTTVQKCVRAGGKHNDLDQVGFTPRHHTFFEMLGNFSFGAYDKRAAIHMAWRFVWEELKLPADLLRVTVLESDSEAHAIWTGDIGLDPRRVVRRGPADNFWSMGAGEGPCGPCTEIFWDTKDPRYAEDDEERWLEFWNLVFMQFHRDADGQLRPLATPCIDTGMGLERVASIMQGKSNNFDTDEFQIIIDGIRRLERPAAVHALAPGRALAYRRIVADHLRAAAFLIAEGVYPSNTGRGYVLRRIIRRAVRAGRMLGIDGPVLPALYPSLDAAMGSAYPMLTERLGPITEALRAEERIFAKALDGGMAHLERIFACAAGASPRTVSGADAFALYDTHGFPVDLTQIIARDHGWSVDVDGFSRLQSESRQRSRASWRGGSPATGSMAGELDAAATTWCEDGVASRFCGYGIDPEANTAAVESRVVAFRALPNGDGLAVIDPCPFYALGGGQEADMGTVTVASNCGGGDSGNPAREFVVRRAVAVPGGQLTVVHLAAAAEMQHMFGTGQPVSAAVDMARRRGNAVHHTATHLLHAALRRVVGGTVAQAGSLVHPGGLRFDFTSGALSDEQLREVERVVNDAALSNADVSVSDMPLAEAQAMGAMALFTEKYSADCVRVVQVPGMSAELCSGTHLRSTRAVFPFQIVSEGSIGAGTRRIEAVAGVAGAAWLQEQAAHARDAARVLGAAAPSDLRAKAQRAIDRNRALSSAADGWLRVAAVNAKAVATRATALGAAAIPAVIHLMPPSEHSTAGDGNVPRFVAERACHIRNTQPQSAHVVICGKAVALAVSTDRFPGVAAGGLLRELFRKLPGRGGGQGALAQGQLASAVTHAAQLAALEDVPA
ncbi:hypothetical protein LPJ61_000994 [Coemansia biformis]|uniref:Alanine--tRNA ligase n=1 Tax=Coemansia biformis TaxID=1286918 RepID=A0A9W8D137_9FUNG|nr:hypothetical protein LPJ61_000994 [Coemansia biformis]